MYVIKFKKTPDTWFTLWNDNIIKEYNGEEKSVIAMNRYLDEVFQEALVNVVIQKFDLRSYKFVTLSTFKRFQKQMKLLKK